MESWCLPWAGPTSPGEQLPGGVHRTMGTGSVAHGSCSRPAPCLSTPVPMRARVGLVAPPPASPQDQENSLKMSSA